MILLNTSTQLAPLANLHADIIQRGIMVVDDSSMHRYSANACLRALGIDQLYEAADGQSALTQLASMAQSPAVMLLDLEMPVMDGIEVLQKLATLSRQPAVVLATSTNEMLLGAVVTMAEALGITLLGAFRKPVDPQALAGALVAYRA